MMIKVFNILKIAGYSILFLILFLGIFIALMNISACKKIYIDDKPVTVIDTVLDVRYYETVKHDTVIKLIEKPFYTKADIEIVYVNKVDSVFINNAKKLDLVLSLTKKGNRIDAYTININDTLLKRTLYTNVGNDFVLTSQAGKVFIKSKRFYWNGLNVSLQYDQPVNDLKKFNTDNFSASLTTGVNYLDMFSVDAGIEYNNASKNLNVLSKISYRFLK